MSEPSQRILAQLRQAIGAYAESETAALVAEAQHDARARVRALLADAIADGLLESAQRQLARPEPGPAAPEPGPAPKSVREPDDEDGWRPGGEEGTLGWYVYCILGADPVEVHALAEGIDREHPLTVIRAGELAAVASAVSLEEFGEVPVRERLDDLRWLEATARAHEQVLERLREQTTIVPMRLCTVYRTEQSVRDMLAREAPVLAATLGRLEGRTEWGVKVFVHQREFAAALEREDRDELEDPFAEARPGEAYMLGKRRELLREEQRGRALEELCEEAHAVLSAAASEARVNSSQAAELSGHPGEMVLNGVYLVEDAERDRFAALVQRLQDEHGPALEFELTGPWPAYNFVNSSIELAS